MKRDKNIIQEAAQTLIQPAYGKTTTTTTFNGLFSRTTWVSQYQKGKTSLDLNEAGEETITHSHP